MTGINSQIDMAVEVVYLESEQNWEQGVIYNQLVQKNWISNGRTWEAQLWLIGPGGSWNRFEATVVVNDKAPNSTKYAILPAEAKVFRNNPAPGGLDLYSAVLWGAFRRPAWKILGNIIWNEGWYQSADFIDPVTGQVAVFKVVPDDNIVNPTLL